MIDTREEHLKSMEILEGLLSLDPDRGTPEADRLLQLSEMVEEYEKLHYPIGRPTPEEAAAFRKEQENG